MKNNSPYNPFCSFGDNSFDVALMKRDFHFSNLLSNSLISCVSVVTEEILAIKSSHKTENISLC